MFTAGAGDAPCLLAAPALLQVADVLPAAEDTGLDCSEAQQEEDSLETPAESHGDVCHLQASLMSHRITILYSSL